jgi:hypothetical protein
MTAGAWQRGTPCPRRRSPGRSRNNVPWRVEWAGRLPTRDSVDVTARRWPTAGSAVHLMSMAGRCWLWALWLSMRTSVVSHAPRSSPAGVRDVMMTATWSGKAAESAAGIVLAGEKRAEMLRPFSRGLAARVDQMCRRPAR